MSKDLLQKQREIIDKFFLSAKQIVKEIEKNLSTISRCFCINSFSTHFYLHYKISTHLIAFLYSDDFLPMSVRLKASRK